MTFRKILQIVLFGAAVSAVTIAAIEAVRFAKALSRQSVRLELFRELAPVAISNCGMARYGVDRDGGYLLCGDLLGDVTVGYSYGIDGRDSWGCDVARGHDIPIHEYDCFDPTEPDCDGGTLVFHPECIGPRDEVIDGRPFFGLASHLGRDGGDAPHTVVKMDVEGAEWDSLLATPDAAFERIDQLVVEFHGVSDPTYVEVFEKLERHFHVANVHFNNYACRKRAAPFPAAVYEVLFVNKRLAQADPNAPSPPVPHPLDRPNAPGRPDCQR